MRREVFKTLDFVTVNTRNKPSRECGSWAWLYVNSAMRLGLEKTSKMITQTSMYMGKAGEKQLKPGVGVGLREPPGLETDTRKRGLHIPL